MLVEKYCTWQPHYGVKVLSYVRLPAKSFYAMHVVVASTAAASWLVMVLVFQRPYRIRSHSLTIYRGLWCWDKVTKSSFLASTLQPSKMALLMGFPSPSFAYFCTETIWACCAALFHFYKVVVDRRSSGIGISWYMSIHPSLIKMWEIVYVGSFEGLVAMWQLKGMLSPTKKPSTNRSQLLAGCHRSSLLSIAFYLNNSVL